VQAPAQGCSALLTSRRLHTLPHRDKDVASVGENRVGGIAQGSATSPASSWVERRAGRHFGLWRLRVTRSSRSSAAERFRRGSDGSPTGGSIGSRRADHGRSTPARRMPRPQQQPSGPVVESRASRQQTHSALVGRWNRPAGRRTIGAPTAPPQGLRWDGLRSDTVESSHGWDRGPGNPGKGRPTLRIAAPLARAARASDLASSELGFA